MIRIIESKFGFAETLIDWLLKTGCTGIFWALLKILRKAIFNGFMWQSLYHAWQVLRTLEYMLNNCQINWVWQGKLCCSLSLYQETVSRLWTALTLKLSKVTMACLSNGSTLSCRPMLNKDWSRTKGREMRGDVNDGGCGNNVDEIIQFKEKPQNSR